MSVQAYQDIVQGQLASFVVLSKEIGNEVAEQAKLVDEAFRAQLNFLQLASQRSAPSSDEQIRLLQPTSDKIQAIQNLRERNRPSALFNHLSAISEGIPALGWVTVAPTPAPYIKEMSDAGQFYTNRVLKEWKERNKTHVEWARRWIEILTELQKFVKQYHTTGLVWSGKSSAPVPPPIGSLPPPPPPPMNLADLTVGDTNDDRSALFAAINQGENITRSLKKVSADMQTHKNPNLRTGPAPFKPQVNSFGSQPTVKPVVEKQPVFKRDGKKWIIEYYKDNHGLLVDGTEMNNVIYMFGCVNCTLTIKGKVNSIFMDSCRKSSVVFDTVVSSIEFVNCQSAQMQVLGKVPTISIDKTDGCQIFLSEQASETEIVSSKSSEMNVVIPKGGGDITEYPIPEQYKTTLTKSGLKTIAIETKG